MNLINFINNSLIRMITSFITGVITHNNNKYVNIHKEKLWVTNRYTRPVQKFIQKAQSIGFSE